MTEPKEETTKGVYRYEFLLDIGRGSQSAIFHISSAGFDEDDWDDLLEESRQEVLDESLQDWRAGLIDCGWKAQK